LTVFFEITSFLYLWEHSMIDATLKMHDNVHDVVARFEMKRY